MAGDSPAVAAALATPRRRRTDRAHGDRWCGRQARDPTPARLACGLL